jgi:hypothetical protein
VSIEVTGLYDSARLRLLNRQARAAKKNSWATIGRSSEELRRVRGRLAKKLISSDPNLPVILVFVHHTIWPSVEETMAQVRNAALRPQDLKIPIPHYPLATGIVVDRFVHGVWFNESVCSRNGVSEPLRERLRSAVACSFYPARGQPILDEEEGTETSP